MKGVATDMKRKNGGHVWRNVAVLLFALAFAMQASAAVRPVAGALTWTGAESGEWNTTALNWVDEETNAVAWTQGAKAVFNESATTTTVTLTESIVAESCTFTSKIYSVTGAYTLNLQSVNVEQRKGRYYDAKFYCPLASPTGTLTKYGEGFVSMYAGATLSNDLHIAEGRWATAASDLFGHDVTVTVDEKATLSICSGSTTTLGNLKGSGLVYLGYFFHPSSTTFHADGNSYVSGYKTYTHAVSPGKAGESFAINGVPFRRVSHTADEPPADGRGGFKFSGFTYGNDTFASRPAVRGVPWWTGSRSCFPHWC